jgi:hypothetical protein
MDIVEKQIVVAASPETIFRIYQNVEHWHQWDPDTKSSTLNYGLTLGAKGSLTPTKGSTVPMEVTSLKENQHFTVTSKTILFRMDFDHELLPVEGGTQVIHRVKFAGFLKPLLTRMLAPQINKGLPVTLERLKIKSEAIQSGQ